MNTTGGGRYDPDGPKLVFNATFTYLADQFRPNHYLYTYYEIHGPRELEFLDISLARGDLALIDSGTHSIYAAMNRAQNFDWLQPDRTIDIHTPILDTYFDRYCKFLHRYEPRLWGYVELDIGNYQQKTELRQRMEEQGLKPIPVVHPLVDPTEYMELLVANYDRVAFGNVAIEGEDIRNIIIDLTCKLKQAHPGLWIHLLGMGIHPLLAALPYVNSVDSSTSSNMIRFGRFSEIACFKPTSHAVDPFITRTRTDRASYLLGAASGYRQFNLYERN